MEPIQQVIVGVDGSAGGEAALRWALEEADRHDAAVRALMAWSDDDRTHPKTGQALAPGSGEDKARDQLRAIVEIVAPGRPVDQEVIRDSPARALLDVSGTADLVVVGTRGLGGFKGLLLGSVSERVLEDAACPVTVVRGDASGANGRSAVVVGVDGSETSLKALRWAAREASLRNAVLRVIHAWDIPFTAEPVTDHLIDALEDSGRTVLDEALTDPSLAGLDVESQMPSLGAAQAVLTHADDASLIVVGSRGLGRFGRVVLGSTSRQLAHHAPCPVMVIPPPSRKA